MLLEKMYNTMWERTYVVFKGVRKINQECTIGQFFAHTAHGA